jgi:hypothetical protein
MGFSSESVRTRRPVSEESCGELQRPPTSLVVSNRHREDRTTFSDDNVAVHWNPDVHEEEQRARR